YAQEPALRPAYLNVSQPAGSMWDTKLPASTIPRMYHSVATLLNDGSVWVGGSNPNVDVITEANNASYPYKTEYRVERFYPSYYDAPRPEPSNLPSTISYGGEPFNLTLPASSLGQDVDLDGGAFSIMLMRFGFSTHVMNMGARALELTHSYTLSSDGSATLHVAQLPPNPALFVPGPAVLFVVVNGVPSIGHDLIVGNGQLGTQPTSPAVALPASSRRQVANAVGEVPPAPAVAGASRTAGDWVVALLGGVALGALVWL
ncbi:immunoglobulin E-set, partial [Rhodotorula diobovata]